MTPAIGLPAGVAMMLNGFVQPVVRAGDAVLAIVGVQTRHSSEHEKASQRRCGKCRFPEEQMVPTMSHRGCVLLGGYYFEFLLDLKRTIVHRSCLFVTL